MSDCILTKSCKDHYGYGFSRFKGKNTRAHRAAYCEANNLELSDISNKVVRHSCDNPGCINPDHLSLGTPRDNVADRVLRGRSAVAEKNGRTKLSTAQCIAICAEYVPKSKDSNILTLSRKYGVAHSTIRKIVKGIRKIPSIL